MQIYVERGVSKGDCLQKIVNKYGIRFTILREKTFRPTGIKGLFSPEGVELEFCLSPLRGGLVPGAPLQNPPLNGDTETYTQLPGDQPPSRRKDDSTLDFVEAKKRLIAAGGKDPDQVFRQIQEEKEADQLILDKLRQIEEKIETGNAPKTEHPNLIHIAGLLNQNDFSERYTRRILERAHKELPLEILENFDAVQDHVLEWIGESIKIYPVSEIPRSGQIMVLVGPTGVGKTTTIAKLAVIYGPLNTGQRPLSIRMITIDAFRIGAGKQIEVYGDIMEIPVSFIDNHRDLRREIDLYREEADLILVDTIGRSPKDSVKLGEMKELLEACGSKAEVHLVLSASTKASDMEHILQQFEPFNYQAVILTKLDETRHIGNVISALAERGKSVSYITDGQEAHKNIQKASIVRFLINLEEFRIDREKFEKQFPAEEAVQIQWGLS